MMFDPTFKTIDTGMSRLEALANISVDIAGAMKQMMEGESREALVEIMKAIRDCEDALELFPPSWVNEIYEALYLEREAVWQA